MPSNPVTFDRDSAKRIARTVKKSERESTDLTGTPARRAWPNGSSLRRLKITAITGGAGGKYTVRELIKPTADITSSGDAVPDDIGTAGTVDCIGVDLNELGRSSHSHLNAVDDLVDGTLLRTNTDGKRVYTFRQAPTALAHFAVSLAMTTGSAGDSSTAASFVYAVTANGQTLATSAGPERPRKKGKKTAATAGTAYYDYDGGFHLADAFEKSGTNGNCT